MVLTLAEIKFAANITFAWSQKRMTLWRQKVLHTYKNVCLWRSRILNVRISWQNSSHLQD